jgi:hypothetical protein
MARPSGDLSAARMLVVRELWRYPIKAMVGERSVSARRRLR